MPLNLNITPVSAPTLTNLAATATLKGILVTWDALQDSKLFAAELWVSETNDRAAATLLQTCTANFYLHTGLPSPVTRYYWIRSKNIYERTDGAWTPVSATVGVSATTLLAQTADLNPNAATTVSLAQSSAAQSQTAYATWAAVFRYTFYGTGNNFIADIQHLSNITMTAIGTVGTADAQQKMEIFEHTYYAIGTVSIANNSAVVNGVGTTWLTSLAVGNTMLVNGGRYFVSTVVSDTQLTLTSIYTGTALSGEEYLVITATVTLVTLSMKTAEYEIRGAYCLSAKAPFRYRLPFVSLANRLYDCTISWMLARSDASWSFSQSSVLKTVILEEIKR